jgi:midasin (ATPase involved in ribosome maturation)
LRHGDRLVINEVDHASPDVWSFLLAMLDDFDMIAETLPSGETIKAKAGYHVVATMNGKPEDLPEALADRFTVRLPIDKPNPEAFLALPEHLRQVAEATSTKTGTARIGLRSWITFAELQGSIDNEAAARAVFGERWEAVLDSLDAKASA